MKRGVLACIGCTALLLGGCGSAGQASVTNTSSSSHAEERARLPFLSPRIFAKNPNDIIINMQPLRKKLQDYVAKIDDPIGLYFEYLPSNSPIGVHRSTPFIAASLLKLPVVIKIYQMKNEGALHLDDPVTLQDGDKDPGFGSLWQKPAGTTFTIRDMISEMLIHSDNTALRVMTRVLTSIRPSFLNEVFDNLDLPKEFEGDAVVVSPENYTSILRSLYFASSLPKDDAQEILTLMTQSVFSNKLPAGVPKNIPVAHKVGMYEGKGNVTFSDCGIIYLPKRPYSLCIMTQTDDVDATTYMKDISKMIYDFISTAPAAGPQS